MIVNWASKTTKKEKINYFQTPKSTQEKQITKVMSGKRNADSPVETETYTFIGNNNTIKNMEGMFTDSYSSGITPYYLDVNGLTDEEVLDLVIEPNPNYNPFKFIEENGVFIENEKYDNYKFRWNKYCFDNTINFFEINIS